MNDQIDLFEPDSDVVENLAAKLFDAHSASSKVRPDLLRWPDLNSENARDRWRAVARTAIAELANGAHT